MKKIKVILLTLMCSVLIFGTATVAFAAGVSAEEGKVLAEFTAAVEKWAWLLDTNSKANSGKISNQYIAEATAALTKVDLDAAACADMSKAVADSLNIIDSAHPVTGAEMRALMPSVVARVNQTASKYGMNVKVDSVTGYVTIAVNGKVISTTKPTVNQTGADYTGTIAVVAALVGILIAGGFLVVRANKQKMLPGANS